MLELKNQTTDDAFQRYVQAHMGFLANSTTTYLHALRQHLYAWIARIDDAIGEASNEAPECEYCHERLDLAGFNRNGSPYYVMSCHCDDADDEEDDGDTAPRNYREDFHSDC